MKILRTVVTVIVVFINFVVLSPWMIYCKKQHDKGDEAGRKKCRSLAPKLIKYMTGCVMFFSGAKFEITGEENIPDKPCVLVGNHQSYFDVIGLLANAKVMHGYLAKIEISKIPFLGTWMKTIDCVNLDRTNAKAGMKAIREASENLKAGSSIHIFPEGTRSKTGEIAEFNPGALTIATRVKAPVVPFLVDGTRSIFEDNVIFIGPGKASVRFFPPIETEGLTREEINSLNEKVRDFLIEKQKELKNGI